MIEHFLPRRLPPSSSSPPVVVNERAFLKCGCTVVVGIRTDNRELATLSMTCSDGHMSLMDHFNLLLRESLIEPQDRPLVEVCDELLEQAERYAVA